MSVMYQENGVAEYVNLIIKIQLKMLKLGP